MTSSRRSFIVGAYGATALSAESYPATITLAEASDRVRKIAISPVELTNDSLQRIERLNPRLNAFITVNAESALSQARVSKPRRNMGGGAAHCMASRSR